METLSPHRSPMKAWFLSQTALSPFIDLYKPTDNIPRFLKMRRDYHRKSIEKLKSFKNSLEKMISDFCSELAKLSMVKVPSVGKMCYDNIQTILILRKIAFLARKIQKKKISLLTKRYEFIVELEKQTLDLLQFFTSDIIPEDCMCVLNDEFFTIHFGPILSKDLKALRYLEPALKRFQIFIENQPKALWESSFILFLKSLIQEASYHIDPELSYFMPLEKEISLSRCLFHPLSPYKNKIDNELRKIKVLDSNSFINNILDVCYNLISNKKSMENHEQSIALLILYRALFNRCYELFHSFFAPSPNELNMQDEDTLKVFRIKQIPCKIFPLPWRLIDTRSCSNLEEKTISQLFASDHIYYNAAIFLYHSIFEPNPIDSLYLIHKSLILIHKGALINRLDGRPASVDDVNQILCFDDLFSLFFGTMTASEVPDIFSLANFIDKYAPKPCLSPSFEYAQANIEALVIHLKNLDIEKLQNDFSNSANGEHGKFLSIDIDSNKQNENSKENIETVKLQAVQEIQKIIDSHEDPEQVGQLLLEAQA